MVTGYDGIQAAGLRSRFELDLKQLRLALPHRCRQSAQSAAHAIVLLIVEKILQPVLLQLLKFLLGIFASHSLRFICFVLLQFEQAAINGLTVQLESGVFGSELTEERNLLGCVSRELQDKRGGCCLTLQAWQQAAQQRLHTIRSVSLHIVVQDFVHVCLELRYQLAASQIVYSGGKISPERLLCFRVCSL